jgi:hypothetical protein
MAGVCLYTLAGCIPVVFVDAEIAAYLFVKKGEAKQFIPMLSVLLL